MTVEARQNPFQHFTDSDGDPLAGGYVYFGIANQDPRQYPVTVYYDSALTQPVTPPLRTTAGYLYRNGSPTNVYMDGACSVMVLDSAQRQVSYAASWVGVADEAAAAAAVVAAPYVEDAETAAAAAEGAQAAAELARDAALAAARIYANTTAGLAGVASGEYFYVVSASDDEVLELWLDSAGTAVDTGKRIASPAKVNDLLIATGIDRTDIADTTVGSTTPNTLDSSDLYWTTHTARTADCYLTAVSFRTGSAGTVKCLVVDSGNDVLADFNVTTASGVTTHTLSTPIFVPAGARTWARRTSGGQLRYVASGTSYNFNSSQYSGVIGDDVGSPATSANVEIAFSATYSAYPQTLQEAVDSLNDATARTGDVLSGTAQGAITPYYTSEIPTSEWAIGATHKIEQGQDAGTDFPVGILVSGVVADLTAGSTASYFRATVYERATSAGDVQVSTTDYIRLDQVDKTIADLGLTAGSVGYTTVTFPVAPFVTKTGKTYHIVIECFDASNAVEDFGLGRTSPAAETRQRRVGWSTLSGTTSNIPLSLQPTFGFVASVDAQPKRTMDRVLDADISISSMTATITGVWERNGVARQFKTAQAISAATGANIRYDTIYLDAEAGTFGVQSGTERANDPSEYIPALTDPKRVGLFNVRATASAITAIAVWDVYDGENRALEQQLEAERRRSRLCLKKTLGKIRRGAALKVIGFGDSIIAVQSAPPSAATPDGTTRDRPEYFSSLGADLLATYSTYTAVQLGRADDGAGSVHTKLGFMWPLVDALGVASGATITYNNMGFGGTTTANALSGAAAAAWYAAALALAGDVIVINFGMNPDVSVAVTEANMVTIIGLAKTAGYDVVVMGMVRRNNISAANLLTFEATNRALLRACVYAGAAFVPMLPLYDARYLGAIGCTAADSCAADRSAHPGIRENAAMGRELVKLFLGAA